MALILTACMTTGFAKAAPVQPDQPAAAAAQAETQYQQIPCPLDQYFLQAQAVSAETSAKEAEGSGGKQKTEPRTEVFKPTPEKNAGHPVSPDQPTQRVDMKTKTVKRTAAPKAAVKTDEAPKARPAEPQADPFAAWDRAVHTIEKEAKEKAAAAARPEPIPEPKPSAVKPTVAKPKKAEPEGFSLEDILAEFSDE